MARLRCKGCARALNPAPHWTIALRHQIALSGWGWVRFPRPAGQYVPAGHSSWCFCAPAAGLCIARICCEGPASGVDATLGGWLIVGGPAGPLADRAPGRRYFRPGFLVPVGDAVWVLDDFQPVGVLLDAGIGAVRAVHSWPEVRPVAAPDSHPSTWRVAGHGQWLWVQQPPGPVARIDPDGSVRLQPSGGRELRAVSAHGAWCLDAVPPGDISVDPVAPPMAVRGPGLRRSRRRGTG